MITKPFFKIAFICSALSLCLFSEAEARTVLKNICNVKGQEEIVLQGRGLVVGLNGTGDGSKSLTTLRAVAQTLSQMGAPIGGVSNSPADALKQLKDLDPKNIAEVFVRVTVPKDGASRTDKLDVEVSAIRAKSLKGGSLLMTPLLGPTPTKIVKDRIVYAHAYGKIAIEKSASGAAISETIGMIDSGARMKIDLQPKYVQDGKIILVLTKNHADWAVAADISELINTQLLDYLNSQDDKQEGSGRVQDVHARAIGPRIIEVPIPKAFLADAKKNQSEATTAFVREVLSQEIPEPKVEARVVINRRTGAIVISGDIEIGSVMATHKSITVTAGEEARQQFFLIDPNERALTPEDKAEKKQVTRLTSLLNALNAVKVPPEDIISILQALERSGKLHAKLILQ